jgi:hypothetical protein
MILSRIQAPRQHLRLECWLIIHGRRYFYFASLVDICVHVILVIRSWCTSVFTRLIVAKEMGIVTLMA